MIQKILLAVVLMSSVPAMFAQSGYIPAFIINHQNDTIFGIGKMIKSQAYAYFSENEDAEYSKYYPQDIKAFRIVDGKYYVSKLIAESNGKDRWHFLEFLVEGEIELFAKSNSGKFYLAKKNEELLELDDNNKSISVIDGKEYMVQDKTYLGYLRFMMSETPELYPAIDKMKHLNQRDLVNISIDYHNMVCTDYDCVNYTKKVPDVIYKLELISGATFHNEQYAPQIGLLTHIWRPLTSEKLYLKIGIIYSDKPDYKKEQHYENSEWKSDGEFDYSFKFPFSIQYVFGKKAFKPTLAFGWPTGIYPLSSFQAGFTYSMSNDIEIAFSASLDGLLIYAIDDPEYYFNNKFPHSINLGLIYQINQNAAIK